MLMTGQKLSCGGDKEAARFQEFWTFHRALCNAFQRVLDIRPPGWEVETQGSSATGPGRENACRRK